MCLDPQKDQISPVESAEASSTIRRAGRVEDLRRE
jgi:hypothetical protein